LVELQKTHLVHRLFSAFGLGIEHGLTALIACAICLLLWSHVLPERRVGGSALKAKQTDDYARYFDLPEHEIEQGRSQKITVVHHNDEGKIIRVE
jgi:poly-beta-1,6-N-acetyl-D-glucosamine biosynthesis protein PgaD